MGEGQNKKRLTPQLIAAIYAVVGVLWILTSDSLVLMVSNDQEIVTALQINKRWFYVAMTAVMLYWLIRRYRDECMRAEDRVKEQEVDKIKESEEKFRAIFDNAIDGILLVDAESKKFYDGNKMICRMTGYSLDEIKSLRVCDIHPGKDLPYLVDQFERLVRNKFVLAKDIPVRRKDGSVFYADINATPITLFGKKYLLGFFRDITEKKLAKEMLFQAQQDWEGTFDTITDMVTLHDNDWNILRANKAAQKIMGLPLLEKTADRKCFKYYHGMDQPPEECPSCKCIQTGHEGSFELFEPHLGMFLKITAIPRYDIHNNLIGLIHVVKDITERKKAEEYVQKQFEHMTALRSIDIAISSTMDLRVTLHILLDQVVSQLKADAAGILLYDFHTRSFNFAAGRGFRTNAVENSPIPLDQGFAGRAVLEHRPVIISNLYESGEMFPSIFKDEGFAAYFAVPLIVKGQVKGVLEIFKRAPFAPDREWLNFLELLGGQAAIALDHASLFDTLQRSHTELVMAYDTTIEGWSRALDYRDKETEGHSKRVTDLTIKIAIALGIQTDELVHIRRGALLHDIGKLGVPDNILLKPGKLTDEEWMIMKKHPDIAFELLSPISFLRSAIDIPYCHHEKWDGTGYPRELKGEQIPLAARIFAIVDVYDALISDRPYRPAWPEEKVIDYIESLSGAQFDPKVVKIFLDYLKTESVKKQIQ